MPNQGGPGGLYFSDCRVKKPTRDAEVRRGADPWCALLTWSGIHIHDYISSGNVGGGLLGLPGQEAHPRRRGEGVDPSWPLLVRHTRIPVS
jgi:hypothetical protein